MPPYEKVISRIIPEVEFHQNRYARGLAEIVRPGSHWLDLGAGTRVHDGWIGVRADQLVARAAFLLGCDVVETHLGQNDHLHAAAVADATAMPFRAGSFDLVTANMVLEHLERPEIVFSEVARVLVPGGLFAFVTPNRANPMVFTASVILSRRARRRLAHASDLREMEHIFPTYYRANSKGAIGRLAEAAALRVHTLDTFNSYPMIHSFWPLTALESMWIKLVSHGPQRAISSNLFGVMEKPRS